MVDIVSVKSLHAGWSRYDLVTFRMDDGSTIAREIEDHGEASVVLPYDPERRVALLVRQFRGPVWMKQGSDLTEPPAGLIDAGEDPASCARREAMEETGVRLDELEPLGSYWSSPGVSTERYWLYLEPYAGVDRTGAGGGLEDEHEDIEVIETPLDELAQAAMRGELADLKLLALVQALMIRRPELFRASVLNPVQT